MIPQLYLVSIRLIDRIEQSCVDYQHYYITYALTRQSAEEEIRSRHILPPHQAIYINVQESQIPADISPDMEGARYHEAPF
ncbi:hypothetical protein [Salibacterium lacus]|uniref:Uncharacterized protein n=1 Tax=Salibacterium lacus TaxID=1898109 RepID=A0ABW5SWV7_9BACI